MDHQGRATSPPQAGAWCERKRGAGIFVLPAFAASATVVASSSSGSPRRPGGQRDRRDCNSREDDEGGGGCGEEEEDDRTVTGATRLRQTFFLSPPSPRVIGEVGGTTSTLVALRTKIWGQGDKEHQGRATSPPSRTAERHRGGVLECKRNNNQNFRELTMEIGRVHYRCYTPSTDMQFSSSIDSSDSNSPPESESGSSPKTSTP
jgi:hypothetical protein